MKIRFWGVRGSIAVPGDNTVRYGGNTSCVSVEIGDQITIFDAGTGIRTCGNDLLSRFKQVTATLFISHTHWDHIQGFPFFVPAYIPGNKLSIYGPPSDVQDQSLKQIMALQTNYEYFPIRIAELGATIDYNDCSEGLVDIEGLDVQTCRLNHPVVCFAYKLTVNGKIYVYGGDHEPYRNVYRDSNENPDMDEEFLKELDEGVSEQNKKIIEFCKGADLVSWDAQYTEEEYQTKIGWGHGTHEAGFKLAENAGIKHIILTHHEPMNSDTRLEELENKLKKQAESSGFKLDFAREGMEVEL